MPGAVMEADERHQGIPIARMSGEVFLEDCHCIFSPTGGMQRHGIDICVSCAVRLDLDGPSQFDNRLVVALQTRQRESKRMMQPGVPGRRVEGPPQDFLSVTI